MLTNRRAGFKLLTTNYGGRPRMIVVAFAAAYFAFYYFYFSKKVKVIRAGQIYA